MSRKKKPVTIRLEKAPKERTEFHRPTRGMRERIQEMTLEELDREIEEALRQEGLSP